MQFMLENQVDRFKWVGAADSDSGAYSRLLRVQFAPVVDWRPVAIEWLGETRDREECDFPIFVPTLLCVSVRAIDVLGGFFRAGELLDLTGLDERFRAFHCLSAVDAMDEVATKGALKHQKGRSLASPTFVPVLSRAALGSQAIFRIPQAVNKIFVREAFRKAYESARLTGLNFLPVVLGD
jgi:hypothetical protein